MSQDALKKYGKGASLLLKMGYIPGKGLGENGRGIVEPIMPTILKRGEGIKVEESKKMMSRVVDEWTDSSDDESMHVEESGLKSVEFNQSDTFKSEYEIPELYEIVRDLLRLKIDVPNEIINKAEDTSAKQDLSLRTVLFKLLKSINSDQPKLKYLDSEINQLSQKKQLYTVDIEVMENFRKIVEVEKDLDVDKVINIPGVRDIDLELRDDLVELAMLKVQEFWQSAVDACNFEDIVSLGELLDKAAAYLSLQELSSTELIKIRSSRSSLKNKTLLSLNIVGTVILKPLLLKLNFFYQNWNVFNVNLGIGVFEEVRDSEIFSDTLFDLIIVKAIVIPKLYDSLLEVSVFDEVEWLVPWLELLPLYFDQLVESIIEHYLQALPESAVSGEELLKLPLFYWLEISQNTKLNEKARKELFSYMVKDFRRQIKKIRHDGCGFLDTEETKVMKDFIWLFKELALYEFEDAIYNEIMLPLHIKYLELYEDGLDYEDFLLYVIQVLTYVGLLSDNDHFIRIQESVRECCEHLNSVKNNSLRIKKGKKDFTDLMRLRNQYVESIDKLTWKKPSASKKTVFVKPSIKDTVFQKCQENGIAVIPGKIKDGKQMYHIENKGIKFEVYFDQKVMFANYNGLKDEPIGLDELL
ncbi:hypothetical protein CANINC_000980 [Pichia inconspicua]|uniref:G-patch domain-containing protein n=1 Tax=Pichia inconspicua TaxID=52247 RepID=A0A4T0X4X4_9ASCO|nr:hypothetical protein CANINC_000980 [[Candida] inconspicua]